MKSCHFYTIAQYSSIIIFHDFPWPLLFSMTFQAWKMVFLNSMTFHDQGAPWQQCSRLTVILNIEMLSMESRAVGRSGADLCGGTWQWTVQRRAWTAPGWRCCCRWTWPTSWVLAAECRRPQSWRCWESTRRSSCCSCSARSASAHQPVTNTHTPASSQTPAGNGHAELAWAGTHAVSTDIFQVNLGQLVAPDSLPFIPELHILFGSRCRAT